MNLRHLRTFVTIADARGVARAARQLNVSQPTASRQVAALEAELGVPLFDRIGRRFQLTSEGEDLLRSGRHLLAEAESFGERARALKQGQAGLLRVGATPQVIENLLADFLVQHRRRHPGVDVHFVEDGGARLPMRLEQGDVHLACMAAGDERFRERLLDPMHVLVAVAKSHPLSRRATVDIRDLVGVPLLLLQRGFGSRAWFDAACQVARVRPHVLLESAVPQTIISLARSAYGIAVVPSNVRFSGEGVSILPLVHRGVSVGRWAVIAWDPQRFLAPYTVQFVDALAVYCRRAYPGREFTRRAPALPRPKERE